MPIFIDLDIDERFFEVLAKTATVAITRHRVTGSLGIWQLTWKDIGDFPPSFQGEAWAKFMELNT